MNCTKLMLLSLFLLLAANTAKASNGKYSSTRRASYQTNFSNSVRIEGSISYTNHWADGTNHSALWLFVKDEKGESIALADVQLQSEDFQFEKAADSRGGYIIPTGNSATDCIDLTILFAGTVTSAKLFLLEMVEVAEGKFALGTVRSFEDRNSISTSRGSLSAPINALFASDSEGNFAGAFQVNSEAAIAIGSCAGCLNYKDAQITGVNTFSGDKEGMLKEEFPKGYKAFYQMRYELNEQQYCDFLNSLSPQQQQNRIDLKELFKGGTREKYGNFIYKKNGSYYSKMPLQACSFLSWNDCLAYADWAGLRMMTELEFEKSARGGAAPNFREFSWGGSEIDKQYKLDKELVVQAAGTYRVNGNIHVNYLAFDNFSDVCGPNGNDKDYIGCRVLNTELGYRGPLPTGIHAQSAAAETRVSTGASYYGAMELSGNVREPVVPIGSSGSRSYIGTNGDGRLSENGSCNEANWLYGEQKTIFGYRGGSWSFHENHARIADRFDTYRDNPNQRTPYSGFRGVRS